MFLKQVPARIMSQRGYGNIRTKHTIKPSNDVNIQYPDYKLHTGIFHNVYTDFPKGAGGVSENPMWVDGTYEEMKNNYIRQADEQNDVRHLIPELETEQRMRRYDLATFTGGTAQQNKIEFFIEEAFNAEKREEALMKINAIKRTFPGISEQDAIGAVVREMSSELLGSIKKKHFPHMSTEQVETELGTQASSQVYNMLGLQPPMGEREMLERVAREEAERSQVLAPTHNVAPVETAGARFARNTIDINLNPDVTSMTDLPSYPFSSKFPHYRDTSGTKRSAPSFAVDEQGLGIQLQEQRRKQYLAGLDAEEARRKSSIERIPPRRRVEGEQVGLTRDLRQELLMRTLSRNQAGTLPGVGSHPAPLPNIGSAGGGGGQRSREEEYAERHRLARESQAKYFQAKYLADQQKKKSK
jgi:hypothetical protein